MRFLILFICISVCLIKSAYTEINSGFVVKDILAKGLQFNLNVTNVTGQDIYHPVTTLNQFADEGLIDFSRRFFLGIKYEF